MSSDNKDLKVSEVKKEAIESEIHSQPIENQGILEEVAHLGGRLAGAIKNTAVAAKDAVVHAGEFTKEKAQGAKDYVVGHTEADKTTLDQEHLGQSPLDPGFTTEKKDVEDVMGSGFHDSREKGLFVDKKPSFQEFGMQGKREFSSGLGDTALDQRDALGAVGSKDTVINDTAVHRDWFKDTGVDKKEVMQERKEILGSGHTDFQHDKVGKDNTFAEREVLGGDKTKVGGAFGDSAHNWFQDTGVDKREVMEERRTVLGERTDVSQDRFDNTSNTLANKAGQLKDTVSTKAGQLKDTAIEKGGQLKDAAMEKGGQLKDAAMEKGALLKDAALEKGGQWKDAAADKAFQLKDAAYDKGSQLKDAAYDKGSQLGQQMKDGAADAGEQLKGKAIDAGHAAQEKGIAMKAAHDKGFVQQEQRADKENVRY